MQSVAVQAANILATAGVCTLSTGVWPIKVGQMPAAPYACLAAYDTPGQTPEVKFLLDYPGLMVTVRGDPGDYAAAYSKAGDVKDVLLGIDPQDVAGGDHWSGCTMMGDINSLGSDDNDCPLLTMNFRVLLERAPTALTNRESL